MLASLQSGRRRLLVADRLALPLLDGGADNGYSGASAQCLRLYPHRLNGDATPLNGTQRSCIDIAIAFPSHRATHKMVERCSEVQYPIG
jgi:hypothetical protein